MNTEAALNQLFAKERISDIIITGYKERKGKLQHFEPMLWWMYLRFESCFVCCESVNQWFLSLNICNEIGRHFEIDDDEFCVASVMDLLCLRSTIPQEILSFRCLLDADCDLAVGRVKTAGFHFAQGETLFFDPSSTEGIRVGSKEQVYGWTSMLHAPMEAYTEEVWEFGMAST